MCAFVPQQLNLIFRKLPARVLPQGVRKNGNMYRTRVYINNFKTVSKSFNDLKEASDAYIKTRSAELSKIININNITNPLILNGINKHFNLLKLESNNRIQTLIST